MNSKEIARTSVLAALYTITSLVPISLFIGAPSFLALNIIITPLFALVLPPSQAFMAALIGGLIALYLVPSQAMFGIFTLLLPLVGATLGSLSYNHKMGGLAASFFLFVAMSLYLTKNGAFPWFVAPHLIAALIALIYPLTNSSRFKEPLYAFVSTMCEQGMMMIFAVYLLGLPWQVFVGILPLMLYERLVGTIGSSLVILALWREKK